MSGYKNLITEFEEIAANPAEQVKAFKLATGRGAVGCFPPYMPEEIIYAAGLLPVGLWGGPIEIDAAKAYLPAFCCSIMQACLENGLKGIYDELAAVVIPSACDTLKCVGQNFKLAIPKIKPIQFAYPQNRKLDAGVKFLLSEYGRIKTGVEEVAGHTIADDELRDALTVYNEHRATMRQFVELAAAHSDVLTPAIRHAIIKSGFFIEKPRHTEMVRALIQEIKTLAPNKDANKRLLLSGISAEPETLLNLFTENGLSVVFDDLAQETRQFRYDVPQDSRKAPLECLAEWWRIFEGCSLAYDPDKKRFDLIIDDVKKYRADGVVVCMMKFCDPEEYDFPLLKKALEAQNIPVLQIEIDQQSDITEQARTRIQGFREILSL